jgi:hypothetical protein
MFFLYHFDLTFNSAACICEDISCCSLMLFTLLSPHSTMQCQLLPAMQSTLLMVQQPVKQCVAELEQRAYLKASCSMTLQSSVPQRLSSMRTSGLPAGSSTLRRCAFHSSLPSKSKVLQYVVGEWCARGNPMLQSHLLKLLEACLHFYRFKQMPARGRAVLLLLM